MSLARLCTVVLAAAAAVMLTDCGERPQVGNNKQGTNQGKTETPPYNAQYNGNRQEWENAIKTRNQAQNEYKRTN